MESERDGEGQMLQEEQGHCTLFSDPFSASHTHYCPDHAVALKHVLIHTHLRMKGKYVMVNRIKHEWRERESVRSIST